jgi:hypothetical protein
MMWFDSVDTAMSCRSNEETVVVRLPSVLLWLVVLLCAPFASAQNNLGELLDAGGKKLSAQEFQEQLVQRMLVGPTAAGLNIEMIYTANGSVAGGGTAPGGIGRAGLGGQWRIDAGGKICTSMIVGGPLASGAPVANNTGGVVLPERCQSWYKLGERYFLSDSDVDRAARVLPRTVKQ